MAKEEDIIVIKPNSTLENTLYTVLIEFQTKHKFKLHMIPSLLIVGKTVAEMFSNVGVRASAPRFGVMTTNKRTGSPVEVIEIELEKIPAAKR